MDNEVSLSFGSSRLADVLEGLYVHEKELSRIPLPNKEDVDSIQALRDTVREDVVLNGVRFIGEHRQEAFISAVKRIVGLSTPDAQKGLTISDRIMRGCSRTSSGADSYFTLQHIVGHPTVLLKPRQEESPPLEVKVTICNQKLYCKIKTVNLFGLYRLDDIETVRHQQVVHPWVAIDTVMIETMDFTNEIFDRHLSINTPTPRPYVDKEVIEMLF